ncbi:rhomboid family intramembrane serine protease [Streptomyces flavofungini]|uniref:Rhomboid family intramembrane serine protease n=1 Tax=Streptomyces flavofungini TaxID=68200 RepID=A0ABS0WYF7_9ACTN|nr:rhomboid family intramembrane serine protease [Streptomyces flavofungini]MBJ3805879.1 rhomboid family intramembrane serine protease [Streptomyces flavofungini]GHC75827.1 rhomboid family intramembrane serine protease [Streptomyces flavofungini]
MDQAPGSPQEPRDAQGPPTCYRHPDRETGITCTRCERPICPECMISASVGFQCPECVRGGSGTGHPAAATQPRTLAGGTIAQDPRLLTKIILAVNLLVFVAVRVRGDSLLSDLVLIGQWPPHPFVPTEGVADGQAYRLVTSMFTHQEIWHIAFNMLGLWWLGGPLEAALGRARYLTLYVLSGLGGSALTYLLEDADKASLGASGAIFGLLGATAVLMRRLNYDMRPVIALLALNLLFTFTWSGIAWQAHVGGLVAGVAIAYGMVHAPRERRALVQWGTCAVVFAVIVVTVVLRTAQLS